MCCFISEIHWKQTQSDILSHTNFSAVVCPWASKVLKIIHTPSSGALAACTAPHCSFNLAAFYLHLSTAVEFHVAALTTTISSIQLLFREDTSHFYCCSSGPSLFGSLKIMNSPCVLWFLVGRISGDSEWCLFPQSWRFLTYFLMLWRSELQSVVFVLLNFPFILWIFWPYLLGVLLA